MAFTEFYCDYTNGANVNGGSDAGSPSMSDTAGTGAVSTVTHQYTSVATNGSVAVGQFISIYSGAATVPAFTSRITVVTGGGGSAWVITYSTTAKSGTEPTTGATYKAQVGGAWKGPNAAEGFPFNYAAAAMANAAGDPVRVNLKNNSTYSITANVPHTLLGPVNFRGYSSTVGDGGMAIIDGGTSGASYVLFTLSGSGIAGTYLTEIIFQNNGATGSASGVECGDGARSHFRRCVVNNVRGSGYNSCSVMIECEAYACNQSNTANLGGFVLSTSLLIRCISHDNSGSNNNGFYAQANVGVMIRCIADTNGLHGLFSNNLTTPPIVVNCDFYANGGDGYRTATAAASLLIENCNFIKNGGYGFNVASGTIYNAVLVNCGFGSGTQINTSGSTNGGAKVVEIGSITYASNVTPWVDPANGDFRINLATAKGAGRGAFTQTAASYAGTIGYPDIGAAQHQGSPAFSPFPGGQLLGL